MLLTPLERVAEDRTVKQAKAYGYTVYKLRFEGVAGAPDRIFGRDRRAVLIEFKRIGKEPTRQQYKRHNELRLNFGFEVHWTDSYERACQILGIPP